MQSPYLFLTIYKHGYTRCHTPFTEGVVLLHFTDINSQ